MNHMPTTQEADASMASFYRTEVGESVDDYSWNAIIHYKPQDGSDNEGAVNVSVGSISALLKRFG